MGPYDAVHSLLAKLEGSAQVILRGHTLPRLYHTRAELQIPCPPPGDGCTTPVSMVDECTGFPLNAIPEGKILQLRHPRCGNAS
jgi:hypothetical protein